MRLVNVALFGIAVASIATAQAPPGRPFSPGAQRAGYFDTVRAVPQRAIALDYPARARPRVSAGLGCDDGLRAAFRRDPLTRITLIRAFRAGEDLNLDGRPSGRIAPADVCLVKMVVGPGSPGPVDDPSTSEGIGIEIWLPARENWNNRIHAWGTGGYAGNPGFASTTAFGLPPWGHLPFTLYPAGGAEIAGIERSVAAGTDGGHVTRPGMTPAAFAMRRDGTHNLALLRDYANRGVHEMALKTRILVRAYYGRDPAYAYFSGNSGGGREAMMSAQLHSDFDGILAMNPAIFATRFFAATLHPQIVVQRDLDGAALSPAQLDLVSASAVSACDTDVNGEHAGWISEPARCRYDPVGDRAVLCRGDGGLNRSTACLTRLQARAINKIWYGATRDGEVPDPAVANGQAHALDAAHGQLWFGTPRGTALDFLAASTADGDSAPASNNLDTLALLLQDRRIATARGGWTSLGYADLARALRRSAQLQADFSNVDAADPDLRRLRDRHGKLILLWGTNDEVIPFGAGPYYYDRVMSLMGGPRAVQQYFRFFPVPGVGHIFTVGSENGVPGISPPADPPFYLDGLPLAYHGRMFQRLVDWVERGRPPDNLTVTNAAGNVSRPLCAYPATLAYLGGDRRLARNYTCRTTERNRRGRAGAGVVRP